MLKGGIAETFCFMLLNNDFNGKYYSKAIDEIYVQQQSVSEALKDIKLDDKSMVEYITDKLNL